MSVRVTVDDVKALFPDVAPDVQYEQIVGAINTANLIVSTRVAPAFTPSLSKLDEPTLSEIEKYLAAHFIAVIDTPAMRESVSTVSESLQAKVDLGLLYTKYGQQAVMLDATGTLRDLYPRPRPPGSKSHGVSMTLLKGRI